MALIAHWPLNGNTNDISGNGLNGTPVNITYGNGKIGLAGEFNGSNAYITTSDQLTETMAFSFSAWVKTNSAANQNIVCSRTAVGGGFSIFILSQQIRFDSGASWQWSTGYTVPLNQWVHITVTRSSSGRKLFVNGSLFASTADAGDMLTLHSIMSFGASHNNGTSWGNYLSGNLNDLRLYDTALTDMEIQEIARAKILHYTFDDMQEPTTNITSGIISNYGGSTSYSNGNDLFRVTRVLNSIVEGPYTYSRYTGTENSSNNQVIWQMSYRGTADFSKTFTVSAFLRGSGTCHFTLYDDGTSYKVSPNFILTNEWTKYSYTGTFSGTYVTNHWVALRGILDTTTVDISSLQIEEKPYPTEYTENTRTGRINDYSGFFNHSNALTETNTPRWTPEAKIGTGAYLFNGSTDAIEKTGFYTPETITMLVWFKASVIGTGTYHIPLSIKSTDFEISVSSSGVLRTGYNISGTRRIVDTSANLLDGNWHLIGSTYDGNYIRAYKDGQMINSASYAGTLYRGSYNIGVGRFYGSTAYGTIGHEDDVRIYATALSDKDIKDLYESRAEIEQSGALYARDFLSNAEETVNLMNIYYNTIGLIESSSGGVDNGSYGTTTTGNWDNSFSMDWEAGKYYALSGYAKKGDPNATSARISFHLNNNEISIISFNGIVTSATAYSLYMTLSDDWKYFEVIIYCNTNITNPVYFLESQKAGYTVSFDKLQFEEKDHATPFVSTYRPAIQLPSTLDFAGNEVHETGTANFEDFSTVGITDGLVGYYPLDSQSPKDYSGNNNNGIAYGASYVRTGYNFDGIDDYIDLGSPEELKLSQGGTISAIVKMDTWNGTSWSNTVVGKGVSSWYGHHYILFKPSGEECFLFSLSDGTNYLNGSGPRTPTLQLNTWYHIVATWDATTKKIYTNGILSQSVSSTIMPIDSASFVSIGRTGNSIYYFDGQISNVKLFNRALTPEEIAIEYNTMFNNQVQIHESGVLYAKDIKQY